MMTTDSSPKTSPLRRPASGVARGVLLGGLAVLLAACGSTPETTNRDRLPRRNPNEATPPEAAGDSAYQPAPLREGLFQNYADYQRQRAGAASDLDLAIGTPRAASASACRTVPVGQKACGGPASYRVYAASGDDELLIIQLAARVSAMDAEANEQFGLASDCSVTTPPTVEVVNGVCVAR